MPSVSVAIVLAHTSDADLRQLPAGTPAWIASTPGMQRTISDARLAGLAVTELLPNGTSPAQWLLNHLDSVDQHHNELGQAPAYKQLLVFGVEHDSQLMPFLAQFGFNSSAPSAFGFVASKVLGPAGPSAPISEA